MHTMIRSPDGLLLDQDRIVQEDEGSMAEENRIFGELALQTKEVGLSFLEA